MDKNEISEEVSVTPVIKDLERLFGRFIHFLKSIVERLLNGVQNLIAFVFDNFIVLTAVVVLGALLGYFSTTLIPRTYESNMVLKMNVDAKEQLTNDVGYFNALIQKNANAELSTLLGITEAEASTLVSCEAYPYSNFLEKTEALNELYKTTDTALYNTLDLAALIAQDQGELSSKYRISFQGTDQTIFAKLEAPLLIYLERVPELNTLLQSNRAALTFKRSIFKKEMDNLDTLKKVMNQAVIEQAKNGGDRGTSTYVTLGTESNTGRAVNPLDIQDRSIFYALQITKIDAAIQEHASCYFVTSHLSPYGKKIGYGGLSRGIMTAVVFFFITLLLLFFYRLSKNKA